jgi:hypothetical protein
LSGRAWLGDLDGNLKTAVFILREYEPDDATLGGALTNQSNNFIGREPASPWLRFDGKPIAIGRSFKVTPEHQHASGGSDEASIESDGNANPQVDAENPDPRAQIFGSILKSLQIH